jgi:energy-coupling factor transporter ATP-binding protein EcfA2
LTNPYSTKFWTPGAIAYRFSQSGESIDSLLEKTRRYSICQIAGPHGSGKSTLLLTLLKRYEESGEKVRYLVFNEQQRRIPSDMTFPKDHIFFIDGAEQLSFWNRQRLLWRLKRAILTVHKPLWFIPILYRTQPQFSVFVDIVRQIASPMPDESELRAVYEHSGGNFRSAFFELYDMWEQQR